MLKYKFRKNPHLELAPDGTSTVYTKAIAQIL